MIGIYAIGVIVLFVIALFIAEQWLMRVGGDDDQRA